MSEIATLSLQSPPRADKPWRPIYGQLDLSCDYSDTAAFTGLAGQLPRDAVRVTVISSRN